MKVIKEKIIFDHQLIIEEGTISSGGQEFKRQRLNRQDAVAVLLYNTNSKKIILTRQFRYAIAQKSKERILEIVAGKIDAGESPMETVIRETEEETGYHLTETNTKYLCTCFASPGYSGEQFYLYYATVTNADKRSKGGGLAGEHEEIELVELDAGVFNNMLRQGEIKDAKTYIAGLMVHDWP